MVVGAHESDIRAILAHRYDNGGDFWATPDRRIYVGNPFSTLSCLGMLHELGGGPGHDAVKGGLALILNACREDGRIRLAPKAPLYPTAEAARVMCRFGLRGHEALHRTVSYLIESVHESGGWRCNFSKLGRGPETVRESQCPTVLFRIPGRRRCCRAGSRVTSRSLGDSKTNRAVSLRHRKSLHAGGVSVSPLQPLLLFYVLSFYECAKQDPRFEAAFAALESKLNKTDR